MMYPAVFEHRCRELLFKPKFYIMLHREKNVSARGIIILLLVMINILILKMSFIHNHNWYWGLLVTMPLMLIAIADAHQSKKSKLSDEPHTDYLRDVLDGPKRTGHIIRPGVTQLFNKILSPHHR